MWSSVLALMFIGVLEGQNIQERKFKANDTIAYLAVTDLKQQRVVSTLECDIKCSQYPDCIITVYNRSTSLCAMFSLFDRTLDKTPTILHGNFDVRHFMVIDNTSLKPSCPYQPPSLKNANASDGSQLVGSVRTYTCHHGYLDISTSEMSANATCLGNLTWSHPTLQCSVLKCPRPPPSLKNANVSDGSWLVGSIRTYTCHLGYLDTSTNEMTANTTCLGNLTWSRVALKCLVPSCPNQPPPLKNAKVNGGSRLLGSIRTYKCHQGYRDKSTNEIVANTSCLGNLTWSRVELKCSVLKCPSELPLLKNAKVGDGSRLVGSIRTYTCHRGYRDKSLNEMTANTTCLENLTWSRVELKCLVPSCPSDPPSLINAKISDGSRLVGSIRTYTCHQGYRDKSTNEMTANTKCLEKLTWSTVEFKCSALKCPRQLPFLKNADYNDGRRLLGSIRMYTCHQGYRDKSTNKRTAKITCLENLTWSRVALKCSVQAHRCLEEPPPIKNAKTRGTGRAVGSVWQYRCHRGYMDEATIVAKTTCLRNLTWSHTGLKCTGPWLLKITPATKRGREYIELTKNELKKVFADTTLIFEVKTCNNANVHFGEYEDNQRFADKICIAGGGAYYKIEGCNYKYEKDIVSCTEFRPFWITFRGDTITIGKGLTVGESEVITCGVHKVNLIHLRLSTYVRNKGVWKFLYH